MSTSAQISYIKQMQAGLAAFAMLTLNGTIYKDDANIQEGDIFDYLVVGGGTAGAVVAARLVEANFSVLVIEAGGNPGVESHYPGLVTFVKNSRIDWNYTTVPDNLSGQCLMEGSGPSYGKAIGGSGNTNYMLYSRGNPSDYEKIYEITDDPTWKWENMLKYFIMSERLDDEAVLSSAFGEYHGSNGTIGVTKDNREVCDEYLRAFEEAGENVVVDNIGAGVLGYSSGLYHIVDGHRTTSSESYLPPLNDNPNLYLTRHSTATKILFDDDNNAMGVTYLKNGEVVTVFANYEVIVTAGSVKTPQLLMLSGIGPKTHLKDMDITVISDLPVGQNLQNGVGTALMFKTNRQADPEPFNVHEFPVPVIVGYAAFNKEDSFPNYESLNSIVDDYEHLISFCGFTLGIENSICDRLYELGNGTQVLWTNIIALNPKSRGEIRLRSLNPEDQPIIETGYFSDDQDLEDVVDAVLDLIKIESTPFGQANALEFLPVAEMCRGIEFGTRDYWSCYVLCMTFVAWRDTGTCAIGDVVDTNLLVIGVQRLRVVDSSVFPYALGGAILAPTVALAEKAAEIIIADQTPHEMMSSM
ncbi:unnamed protein product [Chrysodeixis includens]|uniref:Glucose-methanol-choline oxidoreductase N-terminal domain-containing protein n=1 Tax=Chrysodeixis includens TaxID=689277 RepID=A0A9N8L3D4_CHRIL|nr:unnamed protein product [Chrysodeixis includens]